MEDTKTIKIDSSTYEDAIANRHRTFSTTKDWIGYLIEVGLNFHLGLDPYGRLRKPSDRKEKNKKGSEVLSTTYSSNTINKEKIKKWKFDINALPEGHGFYKDLKHLIADFWRVKKGSRSEAAYKQLIGENGIGGIYNKYGEAAVKEQLETAIASEWQSITLKNYEAFGRPKNSVKEPADNHPAGKVFKASDIYN